MIRHIASITSTIQPHLNKSPFIYELTKEAADYNSKIIARHNYDLTRLIAAHPNTEISYGSEFRPSSIIEPILKHHILWDYINNSLKNGVKTKFFKITEHQRRIDLEEAINRGNHKSAKSRPSDLSKLVDKDIKHGFQLPINIETA